MTSLSALNDHLFAQLDRLGAQNLAGDDLEAEGRRLIEALLCAARSSDPIRSATPANRQEDEE